MTLDEVLKVLGGDVVRFEKTWGFGVRRVVIITMLVDEEYEVPQQSSSSSETSTK